MHSMLSLHRRMVVAAAAAGALSVGVPLAGSTVSASAAVFPGGPAQSQSAPSRDTTTVTTTCTYGLVIVLASPFMNIPCDQPISPGGTVGGIVTGAGGPNSGYPQLGWLP